MLFDDRVSKEFADKVKKISGELGINPSHLMAVMGFETGYSFSPSIKNASTGATGLIQFMPSTAKAMGTTTSALAAKSAVDQLDDVKKYVSDGKKTYGNLSTLVDLYLLIFYPVAIKKDDAYEFSAPVYAVNKGFDVNKDGKITKAEVAAMIASKTEKNKGNTVEDGISKIMLWGFAAVPVGIALFFAINRFLKL